MRKILIFTLLISILGGVSAQGNEFRIDPQFYPATGDGDFDDLLINLNMATGRTVDEYIADLSSSFNVPKNEIAALLYKHRMQPADAFILLQIARIGGHPHKKIINLFKLHRRKGWGAIVISLGIKPGSRIFRRLKQDIPPIIWNYTVVQWDKGSKGKKGSKGRKGSKRKKGSKGKKGSKK